jgi:F-type H+-transporting ATPase subunit epsilon
MTLTVQVCTPDSTISYAPVQSVILPGSTGKLEILNNHAPLLTCLNIGVMRIRINNKWIRIVLMGGFAQVENNEVIVLSNEAVLGEQINPQMAQVALAEAEANFNQAQSQKDKILFAQALQKAQARFQAALEST